MGNNDPTKYFFSIVGDRWAYFWEITVYIQNSVTDLFLGRSKSQVKFTTVYLNFVVCSSVYCQMNLDLMKRE